MTDGEFTDADHERARRAGEAAMAKQAAGDGAPAKPGKRVKFPTLGV
jgi:hypothetical protein